MPKVTIQTPNIQGGQNTTETCNKIKCLTIQSSCSSVLCVCEDTGGVENESPRTMSSPGSLATSRKLRKQRLEEHQTNQTNLDLDQLQSIQDHSDINPQVNPTSSHHIKSEVNLQTNLDPKSIACKRIKKYLLFWTPCSILLRTSE